MELNVFELLIKMGFEPSRKGFALIAKSVVVILKNNCKPMKVNEIYNEVCGEFTDGVKYSTYHRNIRSAIEHAYISDRELYRELFFGQRPKVKDALYQIALKMKMMQEEA